MRVGYYFAYWRAKRTLSGEVDGKFCIAVMPIAVYICVLHVHNPESRECTDDFTDDLKKKNNK